MTRIVAAQMGLLAFACAIFAGLYAGNSATTIMSRALLALLAGVLVGQSAALVGKLLLREHLQRRKTSIDKAHVAAMSAAAAPAEDSAE